VSKAIYELVDELPTGGLTVMSLKALDFIIPGEWQNLVGFDNTITAITGETDPDFIQQVGERAVVLFNDKSQGYQTALWLYDNVDKASSLLGTAALANKVGETIPLLGFLSNLTPKPDKAQSIDLTIKLVVELVAFCQINGIPGDSIGDFVGALGDYSGESLMRMAALICFDGLIPLGPDFILKGLDTINSLTPNDLSDNPTFKGVSNFIPGGSPAGQLGFITQSFDAAKGWIGNFVSDHNLSVSSVTGNLRGFMEFSDDKLDYLAALLDTSTNYYYHTGVQTLARRLIERAASEI
jgi:hypothetical protein